MNKYLKFSKEVTEALKNNLPLVALESTIISHGMPYPENLNTALMCEEIIRKNGAVPATIAIIDGMMCVGLEKDELIYLAKEKDQVIKTSRRDIPYIVAAKLNGATTVSATMYIASLAKIKVFATGGIGGVHMGASETFDISCDLEELSKTNVAVVCAGAKAILDLPKTLEYLETKGVLVLGYKTKKLPAFYTKSSSLEVDYQVDSPKDIANIMHTKWDLGLEGGILITNPIPDEYSLDEKKMKKIIDNAITKAKENNIKGKEITPFLLSEIKDLTKGESLKANIELVYNNCKLATLVAKAYYSNDEI